MIVRRFSEWALTAAPSQRADGASALARAYLYADLDPAQRAEAEMVLTRLLDDPSPRVRQAMAESFASAIDAPHHIVLALADDQSDVSAIVLGRSPLLSDAELIDCAAIGDAFAQSAVALRPRLSAPVAAAIAEIGAREALIALVVNPGADIPAFSLARMVERFGEDGEMREALLSRADLPAPLRAALVAATAEALLGFVTDRAWLSPERARRIAREAQERATVIIAGSEDAKQEGLARLVAHLRAAGQLTVSLVLRALLSRNLALFEAVLCDLSGLPLARVRGLIADWRSGGFAALYRKAGFPPALLPGFRAALDALAAQSPEEPDVALSRRLVERVVTACETVNTGELDKLLALLRRFEAEAAREGARLAPAAPATPTAPLYLTDAEAAPYPLVASDRAPPAAPVRALPIDFTALEAELVAA
jgi:uncharacterized protein (DUF2336 family)